MISAAEARVLSNRRRHTQDLSEWIFKQVRKAANEGDTECKLYFSDIYSKFQFTHMDDLMAVMPEVNQKMLSMGFNTKAYKNKFVINWEK